MLYEVGVGGGGVHVHIVMLQGEVLQWQQKLGKRDSEGVRCS
jgi:hypothetical protein